MVVECPNQYQLIDGECLHYIWPLSVKYVIGLALSAFISGLASIAGMGGGAISVVIFILFFDYTPKDATIVVLCSVFGAAFGNAFNLMRKAFNGKPIINYEYVFAIIPLMFAGSFIGILMNKLLPSVVICLIILAIRLFAIKKSYTRFRRNYQK